MTSGSRRNRIVGLAACGVLAALLLAACSSSPSGGSASGSTTTSSSGKSGGGSGDTSGKDSGGSTSGSFQTTTTIHVPGATTIPYNAALNARQDVTLGVCTNAFGTWTGTGTVHNSSGNARDYQIVVDYITQPGDTVQSTQIVTTPTVQPGATINWKTSGSAPDPHTICVIRQVQAPAPTS